MIWRWVSFPLIISSLQPYISSCTSRLDIPWSWKSRLSYAMMKMLCYGVNQTAMKLFLSFVIRHENISLQRFSTRTHLHRHFTHLMNKKWNYNIIQKNINSGSRWTGLAHGNQLFPFQLLAINFFKLLKVDFDGKQS